MQTYKTAEMFPAFIHEDNTHILVLLQSTHGLYTEATRITPNGKEKHHDNCPKCVHSICQFINDIEHKYHLKGSGREAKYILCYQTKAFRKNLAFLMARTSNSSHDLD